MSSLILPTHVGEARMQQRNLERAKQQRAAALAADPEAGIKPRVKVAADDAQADEFFASEKQRIRDQCGWVLDKVQLFLNAVLVAIYVRPEKMPGSGIMLPFQTRDEDVYQGTCGIVLKLGPRCFEDSDTLTWTEADKFKVDDWVMFRRGDANGFRVSLNGVECIRFETERGIKMAVPRPDLVF